MRRPVLLLILGYVLLATAWSVANAPFAAPDEISHYERAVGIAATGALIGPKIPRPYILPDDHEERWTEDQSRGELIPAGLDPGPYTCMEPFALHSARCQYRAHSTNHALVISSPAGNFQPLPYLLPAVVMQDAHHPPSALRLGRLASLLPCLLLIAGGLLALGARGLALLGPLIALTPQTIFLASSLTGSGLEVSSSFAFLAALLALSRDGPESSAESLRRLRLRWAFLGLAGLLLALSRTLGTAWVVMDSVVVLAIFGRHQLLAAARRVPRTAVLAGSAVFGGLLVNRLWEAAHGSHPSTSPQVGSRALDLASRHWGDLWFDAIARFGYLEVRPQLGLVILYALGVVLTFALAARLGSRRERRTLIALIVLVAVGLTYFSILIFARSGFALQGRDVMPAILLPAIIAGELVHRHRSAIAARWRALLIGTTAIAVALFQLYCFLSNSRRYAVGPAGWLTFLRHPQWSPPAGWVLWIAVATIGSAALAAAGILLSRRAHPPAAPA
jgi:hypothetical protein